MIWLYSLAIYLFSVSSYADTVAMRGGIVDQSLARSFIAMVAAICGVSLLVWSFLRVGWWMPILSIAVAGLSTGAVVNRSTWPFFYRLRPYFDAAVILSTIILWRSHP